MIFKRPKRLIAGIIVGGVIGYALESVNALNDFLLPPRFILLPVSVFVSAFIAVIIRRTEKIELPGTELLPTDVAKFIELIVKKMRYRKKVRAEVKAELACHFEDELKDCKTDTDRQQKAQSLIEDFGDPKLLAILLRRAKKRCRPLWRTIVVRTFQVTSVSMLCLILYAASFLVAKPNLKIDYVEVFNEMAQPDISDRDNAWPHYEKAMDAYVEPNEQLIDESVHNLHEYYGISPYRSFSDLDENLRANIRDWLGQNQTALNHLLRASYKPYCYREYKVSENNQDKWTMGILLPDLSTLKRISKASIWRSRLQRDHRQTTEALKTSQALVRIGRHFQLHLTIIEQLVGIAIGSLGEYETLRILEAEEFKAEELLNLQNDLRQIYSEGFPLMNIEPEKFFFRDTVQQVFTDGGLGGGHLIPKRMAPLMSFVYGDEEMDKFIYLPASLIHARRNETLERANQVYDEMIELSRMTPYTKHINDHSSQNIVDALPKYRLFLCRTFVPALDKAGELSYRARSLYEASITVIALKRWRLEKDAYPDDLAQLVDSVYLEKVPIDPFSDKPLVYRKNGDDFILYSVGRNFTDDGGKWGSDDLKRKRRWDKNGDSLFWPVDVLEAE
ncbi:MAG: hypothetical protein ACYSWP_12935 [Planctomycetota bacterium]|jgi:hypothetical protein